MDIEGRTLYLFLMAMVPLRLASLITDGDRNTVRSLYDRLQGVPGGKRLFSRLIGAAAPYTGTIGAMVRDLRDGHAEVVLRDRRAIRNHLGSVHAVALANLAELAGNIAVSYTLPDDARFIVAAMNLEYLKKARGTLVATGECPLIASSERREYDVNVKIRDGAGDDCVHATLKTLVGPKRKR